MKQAQIQSHQVDPRKEAERLNPSERAAVEAADTQLGRDQQETSQVLGADLSKEYKSFRRNILQVTGGISVYGALLIAGRLYFGDEKWKSLLSAQVVVSGTLAALLIASICVVSSARKPRLRRRDLASRVVEQNDIRNIGSLIDALQLDDGSTRDISKRALITLLPQLQSDDGWLLNPSQRAKLCGLLGTPPENPLYKDVRELFQPASQEAIDLRVSILKAFEQVGDNRAIQVVSRLANSQPKSPGELRINTAAKECLPILLERAEMRHNNKTLLRGSRQSTVCYESLLRAVESSHQDPPEELLRGSEPNS